MCAFPYEIYAKQGLPAMQNKDVSHALPTKMNVALKQFLLKTSVWSYALENYTKQSHSEKFSCLKYETWEQEGTHA